MREFEIGDTVVVTGVVETLGNLHVRIKPPNGDKVWLPRDQLQLVEPEPFSVGDRVETGTAVGTIDSITQQDPLHRVVGNDGNVMGSFTARWLKPAPSKPEYRVVREDDSLGVQRIEDNLPLCWMARVYMSDPKVVETAIVDWAREFGIDADEARKLAAEPQIIGRHSLDYSTHTVAIRHGSGWCVILAGRNCDNAVDTLRYSTPQNERIGKAIFPGIKGPYEVKP